MSLIYLPSPWIQTFKQPTLSSVSLSSASLRPVALHRSPIPPPTLHPPLPGWGQIIVPAPTPRPAPSCAPDTASCGRASPSAGTGSRSSAPPGSDHRCWTPGAARKQSAMALKLVQWMKCNKYEQRYAAVLLYRYAPVKKKKARNRLVKVLDCCAISPFSKSHHYFFPLHTCRNVIFKTHCV